MKTLIKEVERKAVSNSHVVIGTLDFSKLEESINSKFDEEWLKLDLEKEDFESLEKLHSDYSNALYVLEHYNPHKEDWDEMWFLDGTIIECFEWLGKSPSDFIESPKRLSEFDFDTYFEEAEEDGLDVLELIRKFDDDENRIIWTFKLSCYLTYQKHLDDLE